MKLDIGKYYLSLQVDRHPTLLRSVYVAFVCVFFTACGGSDDGTVTPENVTVQSGTSDLNCTGSRVWGPFPVDTRRYILLAESNGRSNSPGCGALWEFDEDSACSLSVVMGRSASVSTLPNGSTLYSDEDISVELPLLDFTVDSLEQLPECESAELLTTPNPADTTNNQTNSNLPAYKDLVLVTRRTNIWIGDFLTLSEKQIPVMRFNDATAVMALTDWVNGGRGPIGTWRESTDGKIDIAIGESEFTSIRAPVIASRTPNNFYNCYKKVDASAPVGGQAILTTDRFCFSQDGSFSGELYNSVDYQNSSAGQWSVSGNLMQLQLNTGSREQVIFGAYQGNGGVYAISMGEFVYNRE